MYLVPETYKFESMYNTYILFITLFILYILLVSSNINNNVININKNKKKNFMWGTATAAYQVEGAFNIDNRGLSVWDEFSHTNHTINNDNGDIADNHYYNYEHDINLMSQMGIDAYRLSISWTRILPSGKMASINQLGIDHYNNVINTLIKYNITPLITLYHWDTPLELENEFRGWLDGAMVDLFADYARVCFEAYGDRVSHWLTINEPMTVALNGYLTGEHAPGRCSDRSVCREGDSSTEPYIVAHNMLLAHAAAVEVFRTYSSGRSSSNRGQIGMAINTDFAYPYNNTHIPDYLAAQTDLEFQAGWFADPLYFGDYPESMKRLVGARLPVFSPEQSVSLKGSVDFYALNHYSSRYYRANAHTDSNSNTKADTHTSDGGVVEGGNSNAQEHGQEDGNWFTDQQSDVLNVNASGHVIGPVAESEWLNVVPQGIHDVLLWLSRRYDHPSIYIAENGVDVPGESDLPLPQALNDTFRVDYYRDYLTQVMLAKDTGGVDVVGYFAWSFMDNFEWSDGYNCRFGLHYVDYSSERLTRYRKESSYFYQQFISDYKKRCE